VRAAVAQDLAHATQEVGLLEAGESEDPAHRAAPIPQRLPGQRSAISRGVARTSPGTNADPRGYLQSTAEAISTGRAQVSGKPRRRPALSGAGRHRKSGHD